MRMELQSAPVAGTTAASFLLRVGAADSTGRCNPRHWQLDDAKATGRRVPQRAYLRNNVANFPAASDSGAALNLRIPKVSAGKPISKGTRTTWLA